VAGTAIAEGELDTMPVTIDVTTVGPEDNEGVMREVTTASELGATDWVTREVMTVGDPEARTEVMRDVMTGGLLIATD